METVTFQKQEVKNKFQAIPFETWYGIETLK